MATVNFSSGTRRSQLLKPGTEPPCIISRNPRWRVTSQPKPPPAPELATSYILILAGVNAAWRLAGSSTRPLKMPSFQRYRSSTVE